MKRLKISLLVAGIMTVLLCRVVSAQMIDPNTARTIAQNWVTTITGYYGQWGSAEKANVSGVYEFKRGDRLLGYYCTVEPSGYVLVSLMQGLAPVKASSETSIIDPDSDEGVADLLKMQMERRLDAIEKELGPIPSVKSSDLDRLLALNYRDAWHRLLDGPIDVAGKFNPEDRGGDYIEGTVLLSSHWHQYEPYSNLCPVPTPLSSCQESHCTVGCVALSIAQIMRYWNWPPGRDWPNMPDALNINPTTAEINAVSTLCHDLGVALGMDYCSDGCASSAYASDLEGVYEANHYSSVCAYTHRRDWDWQTWWTYIKDNLNQNRPLDYYIRDHEIVCDGWREVNGPEYHMNYGWDDSANTWYFLDALYQPDPEGSPAYEAITHNILPNCALGGVISGTFTDNPAYPHRYVDRDCSASSVIFQAGQLIHFHPRKVMTCTSGYLRFDGTPAKNTRLYTADYGRGALINDGRIVMYPGAAVMLGLNRPD